jgi:hypothetical protein
MNTALEAPVRLQRAEALPRHGQDMGGNVDGHRHRVARHASERPERAAALWLAAVCPSGEQCSRRPELVAICEDEEEVFVVGRERSTEKICLVGKAGQRALARSLE